MAFAGGDEARAHIGQVGAKCLSCQDLVAVVQAACEQQRFVEKLAYLSRQSERAPGARMPACASSNSDQTVDTGLCGFFGVELSPLRKQRRVLVLEYDDIFVGLQVDEVLGMQHFAQTDLDTHPPVSPGLPFAPYVQGRFAAAHDWWVFSPFALAQAPQFRAVAV